MSKIYKYTSVESAIEIIKSNSVVLNNPQNYNDPFDSVIEFSKDDIDKSISIIAEYFVTQEFLKLLNNKEIKTNIFLRIVMKWDKMILNLYLSMYKKQKYFDSIPFLHFLSEQLIKYSERNKSFDYGKLKKQYEDEMMSKIQKVRNEALISCFSKRYDSILMWSHYGDKHKGVCIEFERLNKDFMDVIYSKKRVLFNLEDTTRRYLGYLLSDSDVDVNDEKLAKCIMKPFLTKSLDWKYEEEVRCIYSNSSKEVFEKETDGKSLKLIRFNDPIKKIYLGCRADEKSKLSELLEVIKNKNIEVIRLKESKDEYKVVE